MPAKVIPRPGMRAWLHDTHQYPLPEGWEDNQPVTVVGKRSGYVVTVRADDGREVTLNGVCVDAGYVFNYRHVEVPESHPAVLKMLENLVREGLVSEHAGQRRCAMLWRRVLERNGVHVEVPVDLPEAVLP